MLLLRPSNHRQLSGEARMASSKICKIDRCNKTHKAHGLCSTHYARLLRHGDPLYEKTYPKICTIEGCDKQVKAKGLCPMHHWRWKQHGDPLAGRTFVGSGLKFLESLLNTNEKECIIWPFGKHVDGYPSEVVYQGESIRAHRAMLIMASNHQPESEQVVRHKCGKGHKACINPNHLEWGTPKQNTNDRIKHGTMKFGEENSSTKLKELDIIEIRNSSLNIDELSNIYNVTKQNIRHILNRKTWKHI